MNAKPDFIIGIDPDCDRSGVAVVNASTKSLYTCTNKTFPELIDYLYAMREANVRVAVEAGWLVEKSNYHPVQGRRAEKIAKNVGSNHETGRKIIEMCKYYGLDVVARCPLKKCWNSRDGKITAEEFAEVTGFAARTNQDARDAGLIAWTEAGLPIRVKPKSK